MTQSHPDRDNTSRRRFLGSAATLTAASVLATSGCSSELRLPKGKNKSLIGKGDTVLLQGDSITDAVRKSYGSVAREGLGSSDPGVSAVAQAFGYSEDELRSIPDEANMGISCGNPVAMAAGAAPLHARQRSARMPSCVISRGFQ